MSKDKNISFISDKISDIILNNGRAEDIIRQKPDIIFYGPGSSISTINLLKKLNFNIIYIPDAKNIKQLKEQILVIAKLLNKEQKGSDLINKIDKDINQLINYKKKIKNKKIIILSPNGYVKGDDTLIGGILKKFGYHNVINALNINSYSKVSLEEILLLNPEVVILENSYRDSVSLSQEFLIHPVIKHIVQKGQFLNFNKKLLSCSGPYSTEIIRELIRQKND
tara:strand:+ start:67 stop:738 length:672 start_codon:yes stop_codon:yes gene_type:complete